MKLEKISEKLIKPLTPTPQSLKNYKISFIDQRQQPSKFAVVLFYESKPPNEKLLEESLSKVLVQFYPLAAGRYIKHDLLVDCNDEGAEFVVSEAPNDVVLKDVVAKADAEQLKHLYPEKVFHVDEGPHDPLLSIQATHFPCGGLTLTISVSHRVFDASSLGTFVAAWSCVSCDADHRTLITPTFHLPSLLPSDLGRRVDWERNKNNHSPSNNNGKKTVVKRLIFTKEIIASLKPKTNTKPISNVRIVSAVIAKGLASIDSAKHGRNRNLMIFQPVNMRERTIPPQPKHTCGNLFITSTIWRPAAEGEVGVEEMVALIGAGARKTIAEYAEILSPNHVGRDIIIQNEEKWIKEFCGGEFKSVVHTDWSRFGFYEADFGFGKPVWVTGGGHDTNDVDLMLLMSNREGDGIEAWLKLDHDDMPYFNQVEDFKLFVI